MRSLCVLVLSMEQVPLLSLALTSADEFGVWYTREGGTACRGSAAKQSIMLDRASGDMDVWLLSVRVWQAGARCSESWW